MQRCLQHFAFRPSHFCETNPQSTENRSSEPVSSPEPIPTTADTAGCGCADPATPFLLFPIFSPLPPTDSPGDDDKEGDRIYPLFSEAVGGAAGLYPLGAPSVGNDEEEVLEGGLIKELRRETSAKKRLDMDETMVGTAARTEAKGNRSKRKKRSKKNVESPFPIHPSRNSWSCLLYITDFRSNITIEDDDSASDPFYAQYVTDAAVWLAGWFELQEERSP
ncbi:hypothetical protein HU200_043910 [Digitaria exilis]|uniref:Uncharacterized protein n=1 Tax=Digitaria exilis TaxID=1010633 RepID=A0A835EDJ7_9POAL|nr:hypothetical protein HU200_043910 [Digitaria exilis]